MLFVLLARRYSAAGFGCPLALNRSAFVITDQTPNSGSLPGYFQCDAMNRQAVGDATKRTSRCVCSAHTDLLQLAVPVQLDWRSRAYAQTRLVKKQIP